MRAVCWSGDVLMVYSSSGAYETATPQASYEVCGGLRKLFASAADQVHGKGKELCASRPGRPEENAGGRCGYCR
eukprot:scaffold18729_cov66-Phaeocystis_antarctica.AAC.5